MNRVLSWPHTPIFPALLKPLMAGRHATVVRDNGTIRFDLSLGPVEMKFSALEHQLEPGTPVYVWWKGGGFVCAAVAEVEAEEQKERSVADRVLQARERLHAARQERLLRDSQLGTDSQLGADSQMGTDSQMGGDSQMGELLPLPDQVDPHPLLQGRI